MAARKEFPVKVRRVAVTNKKTGVKYIEVRRLRILICVNGGLKHVNTPDSYLRERCAKRAASVLSVA